MSSRTLCHTPRSSLARLTTTSPRARGLSQSKSRTSSCATYNWLHCLSSPTSFSYEPRTARRSCSCSLARAVFFHHRPSLPWDASAVTATGRVTDHHKQRLAADAKYLAECLKMPAPKKKAVRSEAAYERKITQRQQEGMTLRLRPRRAGQ